MKLSPRFFLQTILLAVRQIRAHKLRSFLTTLGIMIGVASVSTVIAALTGLKEQVLSEFESFGASKMFIFPDQPDRAGQNRYPWREIKLKERELDGLVENCPSFEQFTPNTDFRATIIHGRKEVPNINVVGIWPSWHDIENRPVIMGRPFVEADEIDAKPVAIVNDDAIAELELPPDPVGSIIMVKGRRFLIVGVIETNRTGMMSFQPEQTEIWVPFSTARRMQSPWSFFYITGQVKSPELVDEATAEVRYVMRSMRQLGPDDPDTFRIEAIDQYIEQFGKLATGITAIAAGIVAISLLVGGIGIMNIMLVSVSERTREIGLRKAVGATPSAIMLQFLLEAVVLSLLGGLIGLGLGQGLAFLLTIPEQGLQSASIPSWAVALAVAFSAGTGVIFGFFPAMKAARLDPIEALRHE